MELYIISVDIFLIDGLTNTLSSDVSAVHKLCPTNTLPKKFSLHSLLIIYTRVNLDKKFYDSLSKKEVAVIFYICGTSANSTCFVYPGNSIDYNAFVSKNSHSPFFLDKLRVLKMQFLFTEKECKILFSIFEGLSIVDICNKHNIQIKTFDTHISNIRLKTGMKRIHSLFKYKQVIYYSIVRES